MKSQIRFILFALLIPACSDRTVARDPMSFMPTFTAPSGAPAPSEVVAPVPPTPEIKIVEAHVVPSTFDETLQSGRALAAKGDHAGAREMFEAAAKLDKHRAEPHIELARSFIATNDRALAVLAANKAVKLAPLSSQAWNTKGRAELNRFAYDDAIEAFSKSAELDEDNVWAWNNLGFAELQLKKYDDAAEHFTQATSRRGATGYMWNNLGTALEQLDRLDEARHAYEQGSQLGSTPAVASRKRLEGVKSIMLTAKQEVVPPAKTIDKADAPYDYNEGPTDETPEPTGAKPADADADDDDTDGTDAGVPSSTM